MHGINANSLLNSQAVQQFPAQSERDSQSLSTTSSSSYSVSESYTRVSGTGVTVSISESSQYLQKSVAHNAPVSSARQTPEQTADNILGPIRDRLESAKSDGASDRELRSLLREGYEGFKQGFREALKTLEHVGNLDPSLKGDLKETKHLVRLGFSELRQAFAPRTPHSSGSDPQPGISVIELPGDSGLSVVASGTEIDAAVVLDRTLDDTPRVGLASRETNVEHASIKEEYFSQTFAEANRASRSVSIEQTRAALIEVTTNDGDIVTVDIASIIQAKKDTAAKGVEYTYDSAQSSGYIVEGELDVGELKALDELLNQVDALAAQFFDGNVGAAFESALSLGFDAGEIASFSVALSESTSVSLTSRYLSNGAPGYGVQTSTEQTSQQAGYRNLGDYVAELQQAVQTASTYSQPANLVTALLSTQVALYESSYSETRSLTVADFQQFNQVNDQLLGLLSSAY
jgi:hypothetical protein